MGSTTIEFDADLIRRYDRAGPRYTSYPTADRFVETFGEKTYRARAAQRNIAGAPRPLSIYVHLPFCRDVCYYCACNKIVTRDVAKAARYLEYLSREIDLQGALFRDDPGVAGMHWGGGTPTYYRTDQLAELFSRLTRCFEFAGDAECSIEVDPRTVTPETIRELRDMGFNRVSFGVQDFDPMVQAAIHRMQSEETTLAAIEAARGAGYDSINVDLIYGLPRQTPESFDATLARVVAARPSRVALYNYAHLPLIFKPQRRIFDGDLPAPQVKLELLGRAIDRLGAAGYVYIGMDHFALPGDALAVAQRQGRLRRDFQGYSARGDTDQVGIGVSAIGAIGPTYSQNFRTLEDYYGRLDRGELPVMRGIELAADDLARRAVIQALMCQFALSKNSIEIAYLINFDEYFAAELDALREFREQGLLKDAEGWLTVTPTGRFLIRSICMVFDRYLKQSQDSPRYSRVI